MPARSAQCFQPGGKDSKVPLGWQNQLAIVRENHVRRCMFHVQRQGRLHSGTSPSDSLQSYVATHWPLSEASVFPDGPQRMMKHAGRVRPDRAGAASVG